MGENSKFMMGYLVTFGLPGDAAEFFCDRCNYLWGDSWGVMGGGVVANGKLVVPLEDYPLFLSGLPYNQGGLQYEVIRISPPPETGEIELGNPLSCQFCGRRTATLTGMETHMRLKHDGVPNVAPPPPPAPVEPEPVVAAPTPEPEDSGDPLTCKHCGKQCSSTTALKAHVRAKH